MSLRSGLGEPQHETGREGLKDLKRRIALSTREEQVVMYAMLGRTDKEICEALGIRAGTIKSYWLRIRMKCGGANRCEAVANFINSQGEAALKEMMPEGEGGSD